MRKSLLLFLLLVALSAGLLAGACAAVQGRRETVSYRTEPLAGDPTAADGVELTWVSTCGYHLFWHSTFPAAAPEEAETRFSYSGQRQSWIIELDEDVLELSPGLNFLDIAPDSPSAGLRALWAELSAQTSPLPGDETYTEHNGLISIKREIQLADYLTDFPLSVDRLAYTAWSADREFGTSQYRYLHQHGGADPPFSRLFSHSGARRACHGDQHDPGRLRPVAERLLSHIGQQPAHPSGGLREHRGRRPVCPLRRRLHGQGSGRQRNSRRLGDPPPLPRRRPGDRLLHPQRRPGHGLLVGWGRYPLLLTEEKGAFLLTLLDAATLTPVATQELFPAAEGAPHPQVFPQSDGSFCLLSAGDFLAVLNRRSGAWVMDFTADTSLQSSLGCPLSTPSSRLSLCYDGTRLAITGPCPSTKSEYFLAVYTAGGLEYLGGYTSSLYGNHPPDCYPWGSWQDGSCRSIALEPSLPGTETAS